MSTDFPKKLTPSTIMALTHSELISYYASTPQFRAALDAAGGARLNVPEDDEMRMILIALSQENTPKPKKIPTNKRDQKATDKKRDTDQKAKNKRGRPKKDLCVMEQPVSEYFVPGYYDQRHVQQPAQPE